MTHKTFVAVGLATAATVLFAGLVLFFAGPAHSVHSMTPVRIFRMAFSVFGMITMLAVLFHSKPRPTGLKIAAIAFLLPAGVVLPLYHFSQISIWFGVAIVTIWAIVITWRTKHGWGVWWAGW